MDIVKTKYGIIGIEADANGILRIDFDVKNKSLQHNIPKESFKNKNYHIIKLISLLKDYFQGKRVNFNIKYYLSGLSDFTQKVLYETKKVGYGELVTYREIAERIGNPKASRAVGQALSKNPLPIVIPCHRVIRSDKSLGGYKAGLKWKKILLKLENNL
ncbi:MAG: methylated-DNA--[protein]-cysteine S-methyltransferase [candidate division WOR-3 bacterium]